MPTILSHTKNHDGEVNNLLFYKNSYDSLYINLQNVCGLDSSLESLVVQGSLFKQNPNVFPSVILHRVSKSIDAIGKKVFSLSVFPYTPPTPRIL